MRNYLQGLQTDKGNLFVILQNFLAISAIKCTSFYLQSIIQQTNLSLQGVKQILHTYKLASLVVKLDTEQLPEIPYPALIQYKNGNFAVLEKLEGDTLSLFDGEKGNHSLSISEFEKLWSGVTLLIEKNENSAEPNYKENKKQEIIENLRLPLLLLVLGLMIGYQAMQFTSLVSFAWLGTKLAGTVLSVLLLIQSLNKNSVVAKLCSFNKKTDCNSLLTSSAATLFGVVSLSEIGFFYFAGGLLYLLFGNANLFIFNILAYLSLPFVLWSVWYQWKIAKVWCPLCLGVAAVLVMESLIPSPLAPEGGISSLPLWGGLGGAFVIASYFFLKPFFISANQVPVLQKHLASFKQNIDIFIPIINTKTSKDVIFLRA